MKKMLILFCLFFGASSIQAEQNEVVYHLSHSENQEQLYPMNYEDIEITREGIFLNHQGQCVQLRGIIQDQSGNLLGSTN